jgi:hypothetical protein
MDFPLAAGASEASDPGLGQGWQTPEKPNVTEWLLNH